MIKRNVWKSRLLRAAQSGADTIVFPFLGKLLSARVAPIHEFDIYADGIVIGGVSTSPLKTGGGTSNTGGCDRACSELLWLSLWPGLKPASMC